MAFNFRAKNKNEIIKKNKSFSAPVAEIFEYIQNKYYVFIILDPNTSFSKIKIPIYFIRHKKYKSNKD